MVVCVSAQSQSNKPNQPDEKVLISEWVDGNYLVRRYKMMRNDSEAKYDIHYSVSASKLSDLTAGNGSPEERYNKTYSIYNNYGICFSRW